MLSVCGMKCNECYAFGKDCPGCQQVQGKPFWTAKCGIEVCQLYGCCKQEMRFHNCGDCSDLPCPSFFQVKDPNTSDEEHLEGLKLRVTRLRDWID
jgi:hypothetical protein